MIKKKNIPQLQVYSHPQSYYNLILIRIDLNLN